MYCFITRVGELIISLTCKGILCMESNMFYTLIGDKVYPYLWIRDNQWYSRFWRSTKSPYQKPIGIIWAKQHTECHLYNFWKIYSTNSIRINNNKTFQAIHWCTFKFWFSSRHFTNPLSFSTTKERVPQTRWKRMLFFSMDLFILGNILFQFMFS